MGQGGQFQLVALLLQAGSIQAWDSQSEIPSNGSERLTDGLEEGVQRGPEHTPSEYLHDPTSL